MTLAFEPGEATLAPVVAELASLVCEFGRSRRFPGPYLADTMYATSGAAGLHHGTDAITFRFLDHAGQSTRSMYMAHHWTRVALAMRWGDVAALAEKHGRRPAAPGLDLAHEVSSGTGYGVLIWANRSLWHVGSPQGTWHGDGGDVLTPSPALASHVRAALKLRRCECWGCKGLRDERRWAERARQGWTSAMIARWVAQTLGVDFADMAGGRAGPRFAEACAIAAYLIAEDGPDTCSHAELVGRRTDDKLRSRGMGLVADRDLALPNTPPVAWFGEDVKDGPR